MKIIIAGGRDYIPTQDEEILVFKILDDLGATEVVSGGQRGVDKWGEGIAIRLGLSINIFEAKWDQFGIAAGPIRNQQMAEYSDACILMSGARGTNDMNKKAKQHHLKIADLRDGKRYLSWLGSLFDEKT